MIEKSAEDKVKEYCQCIHREIEHWKDINQNGCSDMANVSAGQDNTMVLVESELNYSIYADKDTGAMYLKSWNAKGCGITVMLNADGTPKIWQGKE